MGTTLEGKQINQTYQGLLKTTDNNELGASAKEITDGKGNGTGVTLDNSGNVTATNVTATSFIGDGSQLTNLPVTSVNTQTGNVVLNADDISDTTTTNKYTTQADITKLAGIEANADVTDVANVTTSLNSISATELSDVTSAGSGSIITSVERNKLDSIEDNAQVNPTNAEIKAAYESNTNTNAFTDALKSKLQNIEAGAEVNNINSVNGQVGTISLGLLNLTDVGADGSSGEVLTTDGQGSFTFQPAGGGTETVSSVNGATGSVVLDTDDINEGTTNKYYTDARVSANTSVVTNTAKVGITTQQATDITTNNAKVGITTQQAADIVTNNAKVGISTQQASDISTNNAKISFDATSSTKLAGIEENADVTDSTNVASSLVSATTISELDKGTIRTNIGAGTSDLELGTTSTTALAGNTTTITVQQASDISTNNSKVGITTAQSDAIVANTAKNSYPTTDATKVGFISVTQAVDLDTLESDVTTNNAKVGITTQQASDITANNAKISFDSTSSTKLAGIEAGAEVNPTASEIKTSYESNLNTNAFTDAEKTKLSGIATGATNVTDNSQIANGAGYTTNTGTVTEVTAGTALGVTSGTTTPNITLDTANLYKVIGTATDHSSRVTLDGGVAEGATSIMKNLETIIFN